MKKNKIGYFIDYFMIIFLFFLIFTPIFLKSNSSIISYSFNEKSENNALDFFEISLNYEDLSNTKLEIISNEKTYSFLSPQQTFKFFPKEYGKHELNFYKDNALIDSIYFIYANENSIYTNKENYSIGEQVTINIISNEETKNFVLELIENDEKKYNLFAPSAVVKFIPNNPGSYKINLIKNKKIISETEFYVLEKEINLEPNISQIVKAQLKIKKTDNLSLSNLKSLENLTNSIEIKHKNKRIEYEIENFENELLNEKRKEKTKVKLKNSHINEIEFSSNFEGYLKIDEPEFRKIKIDNEFNFPEIPILASYAIDPSDLLFQNATITATAKGNQLWKCKNWDFNNSLCLGKWEKILDIVPGENYTFILDKQDPGFIETGIASVNTNKPIYLENEIVKLDIVVVNKYGYLTDANLTLKITSPLNVTFTYFENQITKIQKGLYELNFTNTQDIGLYQIEINAFGNNVNSTLFSYFYVYENYDFDIIRKAKSVIDPKHEYFISEINIIPKIQTEYYNFTEILPKNFEIIKTEPNAEIIIQNITKKLIWKNLKGNFTINYISQPPEKTPELYEISSFIEYEKDSLYNLFNEARPWFLAIDPRAVSAIFVYKDTVDSGIVKYRIWNSSTNSLMPEQNGPNVGSPPTWQTIKCMKEAPLCLLVAVQADNTIDFAYYNESNNQWSSVTNLGTVDDDYRSVDVACEDLSGNCLIAYETSTAGNNQFAYRIFNATSQTLGAQNLVTITSATANAFRYINLYPKYNSNQIAIVLQNLQTGGGEYEAGIWNGSETGTGFIDWQELYLDSGDITKKTYSCSWEGNSNDLVCFYVRDTITGLYAWNYNSITRTWTDLGEVWPGTDIGQEPANIFSCGETPETGDLNHDYVMVMFVDTGADRLGSIWNGTNFLLTIRPTQDTNTEVSRDDTMACSWTHDGNTNVMAWVDADSLQPEWGTYSYLTNSFSFAQWDVGSTVGMPTWADDVESLRISLNPENDEMLLTGHALTLGTIASNVNCTRWTGSTFDLTGCENVETTGNLDITSGREFTTYVDVDWSRYNAKPLVSALLYPLNNSNITNSNVNFTFIVSDDIALRNCSIYLNNSVWEIAGTLYDVNNGLPSNLTLTLSDEKYTWNVLCYDSSKPSKNDWYDYNYTFTLDANSPNVTNLKIEPEKQLVNLFVNISVNVSDYIGIKFVIAEITYPNETIKNFTMNKTGNIFNLTFTETTQLGLYNLTIHAEDLFGNKNSTTKSFFNITLDDLYLETDKNTYVADEIVYIKGKGFYPLVNVTLYLYDPTGDPISGFPFNVSSNLTGAINYSWQIPSNPVLGYYKLNATDTYNKSRSINITFRIVSAVAETDKTNYEQGDFVYIRGYNWDQDANITINITDPNNQQVFGQINLTANSTGNINTTWQIPYNATIGSYNLRAFQTNDLSKKSSYIFSVSKRKINLSTDFEWYYLGDTIYVLGYGFSPNSNITVYVYNNSGGNIYHFPKNYTSNNTGSINFSFTFPIELYEDTFYINATDLKYPNLKANTSFMIVSPYIETDKDYYSDGETVYIYGYYFPRNTNITINITDVDSNLISGYPKNVSTNNNGFFTETTIAYSGTLAQTPYDVLAFYPQNPDLQSLYTYYVLSITSISTDKKYYTWWEIVNISGKSYSETSYVDVFIKDFNGGSVLNYPQRELTNSLGRFNNYFNVSNYCPTDLNIIGTDVSYPNLLNASTNITIRGWWNSSWQKRIPIYVTNLLNENRTNERIFVNITGLNGNITDCRNESRIISTETFEEIPLNVIGGNNNTFCEIVFLANITANKINDTKYYYYYNNSNAVNPNYPFLEGYSYQILYDGFDGTTDFQISAANCNIDGTHECVDSYPWDGFNLCQESDLATAYGVCASPYMGVKGGRGLVARGGLDQNTAGDGLFYYLNNTPCNDEVCHNIYLSYYEAANSLDNANEGSRVYVNDSTTTLTVSSCQNAQACESAALATMYLSAQYIKTDLCNNYSGFNCNNYLTIRFTSYNPGTNLATDDYIGWDEVNLTGYRRYAPKIETTIGQKQNYIECEHIDITKPNITINYPPRFFNTSQLNPFFNFTITDDYSYVLNYSIYVDGIFNGQKGQAINDSNVTLNIDGLSEGIHYIIIEAIDKFSNAYNSTPWNITIDITAPNTTILNPVNFTNISTNSYLIEADAIDNLVGIDSIIFFYRNNTNEDWQFLCSDNSLPYRCTWDLTLLSDNNTYQLKAYANDTVGNNGLNYTVGNITIDRTGPLTLITEPLNYTKLNGTNYLIKVNANDLFSRVDSVFILYRKNSTENWTNICIDKTYPYECTFNYENLEEGNLYEIRAYSNDSLSNIGLNDTIYNLSINMQEPNITKYNATPTTQKLGLPVNIFANITDKTAVSYAYAYIIMPNGTNINLSMTDDDFNFIYNATYYQTYLIGTYNITIYANDTFNNINNTETFTFNITYDDLNLYTDKNKYVSGENVLINGNGFNAFSNVTIYIYNSTNHTIIGPYDVISNSTGNINLSWLIPIDLELGFYYINATDKQDINRSIKTEFEVVAAIIETDKLDYQQGEIINIKGNYFDNNELVNVNITKDNELIFEINLTSNSTGNINTTWHSDFNETIGNYILSARQINNPLKQDSYEFTISQRSVYVFTDYNFYKENEIVNLFGYGFSFNKTLNIGTNVSIDIYDEKGVSILGYPKNLTTNNSGNFNYSFVISNLNEGNYTINVTDLKYPNLNNFTKFEVALSTLYTDKTNYINGEIVNIYGSYWTKNTKITIDIKNESDLSITGYPKNVTSTNFGNISDSLTAQAIGFGLTNYTIIAYNPLFNKENATIYFTVQRKAILE
ncbi:MAG: Ig-like domain-containing protein, partial [Candidatus Woesearchaeota archaeon]